MFPTFEVLTNATAHLQRGDLRGLKAEPAVQQASPRAFDLWGGSVLCKQSAAQPLARRNAALGKPAPVHFQHEAHRLG